MSYQSQEKKSSRFDPFDEEEEVQDSKKKTQRRKNEKTVRDASFYRKRIGVTLIAGLLAFAGIEYLNHSAISDPNYAPDGYLSINETVFIDQYGEPIRDVEFNFSDYYDGSYSYYDEDAITTSRGLAEGDPWEQVVLLYGDVHVDSISAYTDDESYYLYDEITISEFQRDYIDTGLVDPTEDDLYIDFQIITRGNEVGYTEDQKDEIFRKYYNSFMPNGSIFNPNPQYYSLYFRVGPDYNGGSEVTYMVSSHMTVDY